MSTPVIAVTVTAPPSHSMGKFVREQKATKVRKGEVTMRLKGKQQRAKMMYGEVCSHAPARRDQLANRVRCAPDLNEDLEEQHQDLRAPGTPEGSCDAKLPSDVGELQQPHRPSPP